MRIDNIITLPQVIDKTHESVFRSYHILELVLEMVARGDSAKTIEETAYFLKEYSGQEK